MQRIRKISNLFKKHDEPQPDDFLDVSVSRRDKDYAKAKKQLKHVKSMPLRTNKPTYRDGQRVPKDQIVYPLIQIRHHVDIPDSRPSTSSYDTYNSEPALDLLPPPSKEVLKMIDDSRRDVLYRTRVLEKPLPPSPRRTQQVQAPVTSRSPRHPPALVKAATPAKPSTQVSAAKEVPKPVPGVIFPKTKNTHLKEVPTVPAPATNQRKVDYSRLGPPTAKFTLFKTLEQHQDLMKSQPPAPSSRPPALQPQTSAQPASHVPTAAAVKDAPSRPRAFSFTGSDDSLSVYSDQFSVDSVSVLTNESPHRSPYVRYHNARGDDGKTFEAAVLYPTEFGVARGDGETLATNSSSLRKQPAVRRTASFGSLVYQSDFVQAKTSHSRDMLERAHQAAAAASPPQKTGSKYTQVQMVPSSKTSTEPSTPARRREAQTSASRRADPYVQAPGAGIPFPTGPLASKSAAPASPAPPSVSNRSHAQRPQSPHRQYYDPMYFSSAQQPPGFHARQPWQMNRTGVGKQPLSSGSIMHSAPSQMTTSLAGPTTPTPLNLRPVPNPVPQATIRPLHPHKHAKPHNTSGNTTVHPPALQQSLAKHAVAITSGAGNRKSCKAEVVAVQGMSSREQLNLALNEPESVVPVPKLDPKYLAGKGSRERSRGDVSSRRKY